MSIDGLGRPPPGGVGPTSGAEGGASVEKGEGFSVERKGAAGEASETTLLDRLQGGEISVDQYLTARVEEAVEPLASKLSTEQLDFVKSSLRAELEADPVLVELVRRATGASLEAR